MGTREETVTVTLSAALVEEARAIRAARDAEFKAKGCWTEDRVTGESNFTRWLRVNSSLADAVIAATEPAVAPCQDSHCFHTLLGVKHTHGTARPTPTTEER